MTAYLEVIGHLDVRQHDILREGLLRIRWDQADNTGFAGYLHERAAERRIGKLYDFDVDAVYKRKAADWAIFEQNLGALSHLKPLAEELLQQLSPQLGDIIPDWTDCFAFSGFYTCVHEDDSASSPWQLMLIAESGGHRLYCDGETLMPLAGDIVRLHIHTEHGLFPNEMKTVKGCASAPMRFLAVPFKELVTA